MKENDYEQLSRKDGLSRVKRNSQRLKKENDEQLELADEHRVKSSERPVNATDESSQGNPVLKTVFWVLRKLIAPIIMVAMLAIGLYVGYVVIAGQPSDEVFKFETWKHLWDLIFADS